MRISTTWIRPRQLPSLIGVSPQAFTRLCTTVWMSRPDSPVGRPWELSFTDRMFLLCLHLRTNLTPTTVGCPVQCGGRRRAPHYCHVHATCGRATASHTGHRPSFPTCRGRNPHTCPRQVKDSEIEKLSPACERAGRRTTIHPANHGGVTGTPGEPKRCACVERNRYE